MKKKILIVSHVFYPYISPRSFRATELAKELASQGHDVTVYANIGKQDYSQFEKDFNIIVKPFSKLFFIKKNTSERNTSTFIDKVLIRMFHRVLYYPEIEFLFNLKNSLKKESKNDLLISIASPHSIHWGCAWAIKRNPDLCNTWVADCGDPFFGNKFLSVPFYFKWFENWAFNICNYITIPIASAIEAYNPSVRNKIKIIPQGFNLNDVRIYTGIINNNKPTFGYAGVLYKDKRDPKIFLEYLSTLSIDFKFILYTTSKELINPFMEKLKDKIEIRDYIPREDLLFEMSKLDFLINFENTETVQSPSKLIDYCITKRPIMNVSSKTLNIEMIQEFLVGNYSKSLKLDIEKYNIKNITNQFLNLDDTKAT